MSRPRGRESPASRNLYIKGLRRRDVCTLKIVGDVPVTKVMLPPKKQYAATNQPLGLMEK